MSSKIKNEQSIDISYLENMVNACNFFDTNKEITITTCTTSPDSDVDSDASDDPIKDYIFVNIHT